jgi:AraC family ethanolamine operon transcriptional activator
MARTPHSRATRPVATASRQQIVERAETYLRAHITTPVSLSTLCHVLGLSERGLRNAFYSVRGMSPKQCMIAERLQGVRNALSDACTTPVTVTGVAADYGFYELGRFAATYKEAFGEAPSETLRTRRRFASEQTSTTKRATKCLDELHK